MDEFHGSVEKNALSRAQDINKSGVYIVGNKNDEIVYLENSLVLEIPAKENAEQKTMRISDIIDLENRLMLIAGESKTGLEDAAVFSNVLTLVKSLVNIYVELKTAGCLLFSKWMATIRCAAPSKQSAEILRSLEICFDDRCSMIVCHENVVDTLIKITTVMRTVHDRWKDYLGQKRSQFYHLNYFNIHQIIYLCHKLADINDDNDLPDQVFTLLKFVKDDVCKEELSTMLEKAIKFKVELEDDENDNVADETGNENVSKLDQKRKMVKTLVEIEDIDITEEIAKAAVQQSTEFPLDEGNCVLNCIDLMSSMHDEGNENIRELAEQFDQEMSGDVSMNDVNAILSVVNDRSLHTLQSIISALLNKAIDESIDESTIVKTVCERYISKTSTTSLKDYISVEHLGILLKSLNQETGASFFPKRKFPKGLNNGTPNLLICQQCDFFATLLSLYKYTPDQPLPMLSEVLLYSHKTTKEEIEIFLRRAIGFQSTAGSCIFCLATAEELSFDAANTTVNMIRQLEGNSNAQTDYKLVIICCSSQDYIASLLFENRVEYSVDFKVEDMKKYLSSKLEVDASLRKKLVSNRFTLETSVLLVTSTRAGMGKSLHIQRLQEHLPPRYRITTIRLLDKQLDEEMIMDRLLPQNENIKNDYPIFLHLDVMPSVQFGVFHFIYKLLILGGFSDVYGRLWRRHATHVYVLEYTNLFHEKDISSSEQVPLTIEQCLMGALPSALCLSPKEELNFCNRNGNFLTGDLQECQSEVFQRPYQYLKLYGKNENLDEFSYSEKKVENNTLECIRELLKHSSVSDPTWSELRHFVSFLNNQLSDCEKSTFCNLSIVGRDSGLSGFKNFVVRFMIMMSQDFATPSLVSGNECKPNTNEVFNLHQLRRRWEENAHPYLFFNEDHHSLTFLNISIDNNGNLMDPKKSTCLEKQLIQIGLLRGLKRQKVNVNQNFDLLARKDKIKQLCRVMGLKENLDSDPDPNYELTTDNVLKMLAIHMRFRCGIPVVVMGETGCGKTRMIEFMCKLKLEANQKLKKEQKSNVKNIKVVKVHGGISIRNIQKQMKEAVKLSQENKQHFDIDTMLFLDEANTTEAIYAIKEFVCDGTIDGKRQNASGLQIICACNPYKKHSPEAIQKMSEAGLGFRVRIEDTSERLGNIPMRCLVYRVVALPPSMLSLVWDFGQLSGEAEMVYIQQMVKRLRDSQILEISLSNEECNLINAVLFASQTYRREEKNEFFFVSLRDVERCLQSFVWFCRNSSWLYQLVDGIYSETPQFSVIMRSLIHAIGMCYHVTLNNREGYRKRISQCLQEHNYQLSAENILNEITACQKLFCKNLDLEDNIAQNEALRENSFMIIMCAEMKVPLFLIGKPGSSKSLAKTVVMNAMQGSSSKNELFKKLKQIHVLSFQCSAVTKADGIESVFKQCRTMQEQQDSRYFISVVVLDEVGLAEDSSEMPLKILHPFLEKRFINFNCGLTVNKNEENFENIGFVGISNWALDPAKTNRGIFVIREHPSESDLDLTARKIFSSDETKFQEIDQLVKLLTKSYLEIRSEQKQEFFGLRDCYGLWKQIFSVVKKKEEILQDVTFDAIQRNFSGGKIDCFDIFFKNLQTLWPDAKKSNQSVKKMIADNLKSVNYCDDCESFANNFDSSLDNCDSSVNDCEGSVDDCESRFLLLLTNRFAATSLLNRIVDDTNFQIVFGSSFPQDNNYTELCKNISKIKNCMESGTTIVLLNLKDLYESLYDALNQHYVIFRKKRFVDLGLGGHRVKCRIAKKFRLIVIEDKDLVYKEFPIPLINRLEKHFFNSENILSDNEMQLASEIKSWVTMFTKIAIPMHKRHLMKQFSEQQSFMGYNEDSAASALLYVFDSNFSPVQAQHTLLNTATVDSVFRLPKTQLRKEAAKVQHNYMVNQSHDNLVMFLHKVIQRIENHFYHTFPLIFEITSFSHILSENDKLKVEDALGLKKNSVSLLSLQQFQTREGFASKVKLFFKCREDKSPSRTYILLIQCHQAPKHGNLIACSRFTVKNIIRSWNDWSTIESSGPSIIIAFLYTMNRQSNTEASENNSNFHSYDCESVYIDELRPSVDYIGPLSRFWKKSISELLNKSVLNQNNTIQSTCKFMDSEYLFDPIRLVRSCFSIAMLKVVSHQDNKERNRVDLLHNIFSDSSDVCSAFQSIVLHKIIGLLEKRDELSVDPTSWLVDEACSQEALYEGGTFSKVLWQRLRKTMSLVLAKIVSVIDEDNNLDLVCQKKASNSLIDFWLSVFDCDDEICELSANEIMENANEFVIRGSENGLQCQFPFSRRITECFSWILDFAQIETKQNEAMFFAKLKELQINRFIMELFANNNDQMDILKSYIKDLVNLQYRLVKNKEKLEFQLLVDCFMSIFITQHTNRSEAVHNHQGNFLASVYYLFAIYQHKIQQMHAIFELLPNLIVEINIESWLQKQSNSEEFILHLSVYHKALDQVEQDFKKLNLPNKQSDLNEFVDSYHKWKNVVKKLLNLKLDSSEAEKKNMLQSVKNIDLMRRRLEFVDLILSILVPEKSVVNYLKIMFPVAKRLWEATKRVGLENAKFLTVLMSNLRSCSKDLYLKLLLSWEKISCNLCKKQKIINPVILPCKHYCCKSCIPPKSANLWECWNCRKKIPDNFVVAGAKLSLESQQEFEDFKHSCTSFFFQYLSTLLIPLIAENNSENFSIKDIWKDLENLVIKEKDTREMTPMDIETFDKTPTVRSYILQILLICDRQSTQEMLENHFEKMKHAIGGSKELMLIYVRCLEDLLQVRIDKAKNNVMKAYEDHINNIRKKISSHPTRNRVEMLALVADVRLLMKIAAELVHGICSSSVVSKNIENAKSLLHKISDLLRISDDFNIVKKYFIKILCRQFGFSDFQILREKSEFHTLIPSRLFDESRSLADTNFYLFDEHYSTIFKKLSHFDYESEVEDLVRSFLSLVPQTNDDVIGMLHAFEDWIRDNTANQDVRLDLFVNLLKKLDGFENTNQDLINYFNKIIFFNWTELSLRNAMLCPLEKFISVAGSSIVASSPKTTLYALKRLIKQPCDISSLFLPTMPQSGYFDVKHIVEQLTERYGRPPKPHTCPSGHVYFIGDCTNPNDKGKCPECGKAIGGIWNRVIGRTELQPGNTAGGLSESSQAGYLLGTPDSRPADATPERTCSRLAVCVIRMFLHASVFHAARNGNHVMKHLQLPSEEATFSFLFDHLQIDFKQFLKCLGRSSDDGILLLYQIMKVMRTKTGSDCSNDNDFSTMAKRKSWEEIFILQFLRPVFEQTDDLIESTRERLNKNLQQNKLEKLVYEIPDADDATDSDVDSVVDFQSPFLWNYRINITLSHLRRTLEGFFSEDKREAALLKLILNETDLSCIHHLPKLLSLQKSMIHRYQRRKDEDEVEKISIKDYCKETNRVVSDDDFDFYIKVWNKVNNLLLVPEQFIHIVNLSLAPQNLFMVPMSSLRITVSLISSIHANFPKELPQDVRSVEMSMESPVSMCLPSYSGQGRRALLMMEHLIENQNNFLLKCKEIIVPSPEFPEISVDQMTDDDIIHIDFEKSLMPLVLANSQYEYSVGETGSRHKILYRFAALEKQITEKFILNKKLLNTKSLPRIKYLHDIGLGKNCADMKKSVPQVAQLPQRLSLNLDDLCARNPFSDVCASIWTLSTVIGYLAKFGSDANKSLISYITDNLMMDVEEAVVIPQAAQLKHTMTLFERLSWQRSKHFVERDQNPFKNLRNFSEDESCEISDDVIVKSLQRIDLKKLQLELNSMIFLTHDLYPESSLRDNLFAYVESKEPDEEVVAEAKKWSELLPEELRVKNAPKLFKIAVDLQLENEK